MFYVPFQLERNFPELVSVCKPLQFFINIRVGEKIRQNTIDWLSRLDSELNDEMKLRI